MDPAAAQEIRSKASRSNADPAAAQNARAAIDALATDLYRKLTREPGNMVLSPYSVAIALAMARVGAVGETANQIEAVLHGASRKDLSAGFNALDQALPSAPEIPDVRPDSELELAIANQLWGQKDLVFERVFLDELARDYGAGVQVVDYRTSAEGARRTINDCGRRRTRDHIKDLIPRA